MNPLLQRILIALGASVATSTMIVGSAQNKYKKTKKRRRKKNDPPVVIGTVAKREAAEDFVPGLTGAQMLQNIKDSGKSVVDFFSRKKKPVEGDEGGLVPDEVKTADGKTTKPKKTKPLTPAERRRRRGKRRRQATLFESAKESFRQVVKEETNKVVDEKIEQTGLKKAAEALKQAGETVGGSVKEAASRVQESIPEDANEKIQAAGKSFLAGARKLGQSLGKSIQSGVQALQEQSAQLSQDQKIIDVEVTPIESTRDAGQILAPPPNAIPTPMPTVGDDPSSPPSSPPSSASTSSALTSTTSTTPTASTTSTSSTASTALTSSSSATPPESPPLPVHEGMTAEQLGEKVSDGVKKIGAFLSGPGNPGYQKSGRIGQGGGGGDVVEAKDPTPRQPPKDPPKDPPQV